MYFAMIQLWREKLKEDGGRKHLIFWSIYWGITLAVILGHMPLLTSAEGGERLPYTLAGAGMLILLAVLVPLCERMWVKNVSRREKKRIKIWHFLILFADAVYLFWAMEFVNNTKFAEMEFGYMALNVLGIFIIGLIFLFWLNSFRRGLLAVTILFTSLAVSFYYVYKFRGEPLQLIDFFSFGTAMDVAGDYDFSFPRQMAVIVPVALCLIALILHLPDWYLAKKKAGKIGIRLGVAGFMVFGFFLLSECELERGPGDHYQPLVAHQHLPGIRQHRGLFLRGQVYAADPSGRVQPGGNRGDRGVCGHLGGRQPGDCAAGEHYCHYERILGGLPDGGGNWRPIRRLCPSTIPWRKTPSRGIPWYASGAAAPPRRNMSS